MDPKKGILLQKIRNHSQLLKLQQIIKNFHNNILQRHLINKTGRLLRKLHMQLEIPSCLGYGPKSLRKRLGCTG